MIDKAKEPVRLRKKALKNGNVSLYLSIYINGRRDYEFLKLYLVPGNSKEVRLQNKKTLELASSIKAKRIVEIQNGEYGFKNKAKGDVLFFEYFDSLAQQRKKDGAYGTYRCWSGCRLQLLSYAQDEKITFAQITTSWVMGFREYLCNKAVASRWIKSNDGKGGVLRPLSINTRQIYFTKLNTVMRQATADGIIDRNPMDGVKGLTKEESKREYLTIDELKRMANAPCANQVVKRAFLFSCLTGLRHSDIQKMTWGEVVEQGDRTRLVFKQKKTGGQEYLDITAQAKELIGQRAGHAPDEKVFADLPWPSATSFALSKWTEAAGVEKHITFHCARHTFAVMMLTLDVDLYTVSKLLGHHDIKTTQIYAKVVDEKKREAVDCIPKVL